MGPVGLLSLCNHEVGLCSNLEPALETKQVCAMWKSCKNSQVLDWKIKEFVENQRLLLSGIRWAYLNFCN